MLRRSTLAALAMAWLVAGPLASAQTPRDLIQTSQYSAAFQNPDGGFAGSIGGRSTLGATSSAIRTLGYTGGSIKDVLGAIRYVESCFDKESGGFAPTPGGKADVGTTASGLMAVGALKLDPRSFAKAVDHLGREAKTFEEVRIAVAGIEAIRGTSPEFDRWTTLVNQGKNPDGTFGDGPSKARDTGGKAVALLRMGRTLDGRDAILGCLRSAQRPDGGWSQDGATSDLGTTYRIMRCFFMLHERPDLGRLRTHLASFRQSDGGYAARAGEPASPGATYHATVMLHWARLLDGEPDLVETAGFAPLFDGRTLDGWEGDTTLWAAKDGAIVGTSTGLDHNAFLATKASYADFILKLTFRLRGDEGANSGVQFRSVRVPGHEMSGYQADIGKGYWGALYDESRRNRVIGPASEKAAGSVRVGDWNHYVIRAMGGHITTSLNGLTSVDYREADPAIARDGKIALQIHAGKPMTVEFKDVLIQPLPIPKEDGSDDGPGFHLRRVATATGDRLFTVYLPRGYDAKRAYPLVLFLHGSGERGSDGIAPAQVGLGAAVLAHPDDFPAIAVFPQARQGWGTTSDDARAAHAALDETTQRHRVDPNRVVITGISMGGRGAWELANAYPDRFAAVAPVCGMGPVEAVDRLKALPAWAFCGDDDRATTLQNGRTMVRALVAAGGDARLTEYRSVPHNSWDRAYTDLVLLDWLTTQTKAVRSAKGN